MIYTASSLWTLTVGINFYLPSAKLTWLLKWPLTTFTNFQTTSDLLPIWPLNQPITTKPKLLLEEGPISTLKPKFYLLLDMGGTAKYGWFYPDNPRRYMNYDGHNYECWVGHTITISINFLSKYAWVLKLMMKPSVKSIYLCWNIRESFHCCVNVLLPDMWIFLR